MQAEDLEYVGFWPRVGAALIDTILILMVIGPLLTAFYGDKYWSTESFSQGPMDFLLSYLFPAVATVIFWVTRQATPGKMAISAKVVDARTGETMTTGQSIGRYFAYFVAMIPFMLGIIWVGFDARKQGWHDKLASTVVVRKKKKETSTPVIFESN